MSMLKQFVEHSNRDYSMIQSIRGDFFGHIFSHRVKYALGRLKIRITILQLVFLVSSCNHLFYYPDKHLYINPKETPLNYSEGKISTSDDNKLHYWDFQPDQKLLRPLYFTSMAMHRICHLTFSIQFGWSTMAIAL